MFLEDYFLFLAELDLSYSSYRYLLLSYIFFLQGAGGVFLEESGAGGYLVDSGLFFLESSWRGGCCWELLGVILDCILDGGWC